MKELILVWAAVVLLFVVPMVYGSQIAVLNYTQIDNISNETCQGIGFVDGQDHPFNQEVLDRCGDSYYLGFIQGCMAEHNFKEVCDQATDSE